MCQATCEQDLSNKNMGRPPLQKASGEVRARKSWGGKPKGCSQPTRCASAVIDARMHARMYGRLEWLPACSFNSSPTNNPAQGDKPLPPSGLKSFNFLVYMDSRLFLPGMDPVYLFCHVQAKGFKLICRFPFAN